MSIDPSSEDSQREPTAIVVSVDEVGKRLDAFLVGHCPGVSRSQLRKQIDAGNVTVDAKRVKVAYRLVEGQTVEFCLANLPHDGPEPEDIPLDVLFEDEHFTAINKPAGMVVHPAKGHWAGTLTSALAFRFQSLSSVGGAHRPGIVHRLDRDTTGVIVVAKTDAAHVALAKQFELREVQKEYFAIVRGAPNRDRDLIDQPIGPHPYQREKMAIRRELASAREAQTFYEVQERYARISTIKLAPRTGRTHQVRLHLTHIGCPVLCDRLYGGHAQITRGELQQSDDDTVLLDRQALHAWRLRLAHPISGEAMELEAPLPDDLRAVIDAASAR